MFGLFGKKKTPSDKLSTQMSIELGMFLSWYEDAYHKMLPGNISIDIANRILRREGYSEEYGSLVSMMAYSLEIDEGKNIRKKTNFDTTINSFLKSISLSKSDVSGW